MADMYKWFEPVDADIMEDPIENPYKELLGELRQLNAELTAPAFRPNWRRRYNECIARVDELFANDDENAYNRHQESLNG